MLNEFMRGAHPGVAPARPPIWPLPLCPDLRCDLPAAGATLCTVHGAACAIMRLRHHAAGG